MLRYPAVALDCTGPWLFWSRSAPPLLAQSLALLGQMEPILIDGSGSRPVLVAGAARVACLIASGQDALCLDLGKLSARDKGLVYLHSNVGLELTEARLVAALRYFAGLDHANLEQIFTALGLQPRAKQARLALAWLRLPHHWDKHLARGALPLACADVLAPLSAPDLDALEPFFTRWSWSRGNAVHFLTWVREVCLRDKMGVPEVLEQMHAAQILYADLSPKDGVARLVQGARNLRFPDLTRLEDDFAIRLAGLGGTGWRVTQPDQFETNTVELTVRAGSQAALVQAARELTDLASRKACVAIFGEES